MDAERNGEARRPPPELPPGAAGIGERPPEQAAEGCQSEPSGSATPAADRDGKADRKHRLDVPRWLTARGVQYHESQTRDSRGRTVYVLKRCPLNADHQDAAVMQADSGKLSARCCSCQGKGWQDFKRAIGPPDADHYDPPLRRESDGDDEGGGGSHAALLVGLALAAVEFFHDGETAYATVANTAKTFPLSNRVFRQQLAHWYFTAKGRVPSGEALRAALDTLAGKALFEGPNLPVRVRLAEQDGAIYLDLGREDWAAVRIAGDGWKVLMSYPVRFKHPRGLLELPVPQQGGSLNALRELVNVESDTDWRLLVGWLLAAFRPSGPYPVLILTGEQGAAKSTTARLLRSLIDPNAAPLRSEPRDGRDLVIAADNGWLLALDNLSYLPPWLSDCLCRLATGGGFATRELYSDRDEAIFDSQRPVILTSIEDVADRADLLDRAVIVRLPAIPEGRRRRESEFWAAAKAASPAILGALLDAVAGGLRDLPGVRLDRLPRMADFAAWVTACEPTLGWAPGSFLAAYRGNVADANELALDAAPIWPPLRQLVDSHGSWEGTAGELLAELVRLAGLGGDRPKPPEGWPKKPNALTGRLRRLAPNMRRAGVAVEFERSASKRLIRLAASEGNPSSSSSPAPEMPATSAPIGDDAVTAGDDPAAPGDDPQVDENRGDQAPVTMRDGDDGTSGDFAADDAELI
jgi:hypothetical protein